MDNLATGFLNELDINAIPYLKLKKYININIEKKNTCLLPDFTDSLICVLSTKGDTQPYEPITICVLKLSWAGCSMKQ